MAVTPALAADPTTVDCLNANEKSIKARNENRLLDARAELLTCAAESCPADVRNECIRRVAEVNAAMPTIVFETKDPQGNDLTAVKVLMEGKLLFEHVQGAAQSIDPGVHTFRFEAAGLLPVEKRFVIAQGQKDRRELVVLGAPASDDPGALPSHFGAGATQVPSGPSGPSGVESPPPAEPASNDTQRILGYSAIGAGAVGIVLGIVFTAKRGAQLDDRDAICAGDSYCAPGSQARVDALTEDARASNTVGVVGFVAGGVLAAGGVALVLTAPRDHVSVGVAPSVAPGFAGVSLRGRAW